MTRSARIASVLAITMVLAVLLSGLHCPVETCLDCTGDRVVAQKMTVVPQHIPALTAVVSFTVMAPSSEPVSGVRAPSAVPPNPPLRFSRLLA